jgi:hypothetical protein
MHFGGTRLECLGIGSRSRCCTIIPGIARKPHIKKGVEQELREQVSLPQAFEAQRETIPFLARAKNRASKDFSWKRWRSLEEACDLAYWLHVFQKDSEALQVCRFVGQYEFRGDFNFWSPVELALALASELASAEGKREEAEECAKRMLKAGVVRERLEGNLLDGPKGHLDLIQTATQEGDKKSEQEWRLRALQEICFIMALGGSAKYALEKLRRLYEEDLAQLRKLLGVS